MTSTQLDGDQTWRPGRARDLLPRNRHLGEKSHDSIDTQLEG